MFRSRVAEFYVAKGYQVHEQARVRGASGNIYVVDMIAEGPLGNLLVSFGDAGGIDGPEMGSVRRVAKDLGMTPVLAAESFSSELRHQATQHGVVLLDEALDAAAPPGEKPAWLGIVPRGIGLAEFEAHPWPESGRIAEPAASSQESDVTDLSVSGSAVLLQRPALVPPAPAALPVQVAEAEPRGPKFAWLGAKATASATAAPAPTPGPVTAPLVGPTATGSQQAFAVRPIPASPSAVDPLTADPALGAVQPVQEAEGGAELVQARNQELLRAAEARIRKRERRRKLMWLGAGLLAFAIALKLLA